jgi:endonuclease-3
VPSLSLRTVLDRLKKIYTPPKVFLDYETPLDLLVAVILSAQCTDARVNIVTKSLFKKYRSAKDYVAVPQTELEKDIHSCGHYRNKALSIQTTCRILLEKHNGHVPRTMHDLLELRGVGRKTASVVLSSLYDINEGIAVDTHVQRLAQRLGLSKFSDPKRIELDLMKGAPPNEWRSVTTLLISHGRAVCTARNRNCPGCVFQKECPSSLVMGRTDQAKPKYGKKFAKKQAIR